ncbi:MAG: dihydrolipoyl dehydrogenase [Candidatus Binatia bacterium]
MDTRKVDVAIIGAGSAGLAARRAAVAHGASVVLIEDGPYGTTCARVGCMPSKLLIAAADVAHEVAGAGRFGIRVGETRVDGAAVLARVRAERDRFVGFVVESVEALPAAERLRGRARFLAPTTLAVGDELRVEARAVVIATGSSPTVPPSLDAVRDRVLVNDDIFELPALPASLAVVGTGIVGLEIGQAMHRLGVRTAFFARSERRGPLTDPEVRAVAKRIFGAELDLRPDGAPTAVHDGDGVLLRWQERNGQVRQERFDAVLAATGRLPNLGDLALEQTRLELDELGVPRFDPRTMQCGDAPIFLAGDVSNYRPVLHEAADEGALAGRNAARYPAVQAEIRRTPLLIAFTDPNLAMVGEAFAALDPQQTEVGTVSYDDQGRARVMGQNAGLVRIYGRRDCGTLLGAEMVGPRVEHTAHLLAWAVQQQMTVTRALEMPFYHPVIEEGIRTALRDLCARLKLRPPENKRDLECGPGT